MTRIFSAVLTVLFLLLFTAMPLLADEGADEIEPNDEMLLADTIEGFEINGNLDTVDTDDWFVLTGQEGYRAKFTILHDDDKAEFDFEVYSVDYDDMDDWSIVGTADGFGSGESIVCNIPLQCYVHVWQWDGKGDYTILIEPMDMGVDMDDYAYDDYDEIEPNDEVDLADIIYDNDIYGYCDYEDVDWYVLDGQEGLNPTFTIFFDEDDVEIDFAVYSGDKLVCEAVDYGSGDSVTCEVPGTCYIEIYHWSGEGEYVLLIEP